jgi:hypothetical protein
MASLALVRPDRHQLKMSVVRWIQIVQEDKELTSVNQPA